MVGFLGGRKRAVQRRSRCEVRVEETKVSDVWDAVSAVALVLAHMTALVSISRSRQDEPVLVNSSFHASCRPCACPWRALGWVSEQG
jgi:hypothetical protein